MNKLNRLDCRALAQTVELKIAIIIRSEQPNIKQKIKKNNFFLVKKKLHIYI